VTVGVASPFVRLVLGDRQYDLSTRALVMGIVNRTPDSFFDKGATYALDALLARAEMLEADGADLIDIGGVKAGPGPDVSEAEELEAILVGVVSKQKFLLSESYSSARTRHIPMEA